GPASLVFRGDVQVKDVDQAARSLFLVGRGTDATGTSGAAMDLRAHIEEAGTTACRLVGASEVSVSGKAATFGGRLMSAVAGRVVAQFRAHAAGAPPGGRPAGGAGGRGGARPRRPRAGRARGAARAQWPRAAGGHVPQLAAGAVPAAPGLRRPC